MIERRIIRFPCFGRSENRCGATVFPAGESAIVVMTDLDGMPVSYCFADAATYHFNRYLYGLRPEGVLYFEYRPGNGGGKGGLFRIARMEWLQLEGRYAEPDFEDVGRDVFYETVSCYGHDRRHLPDISFKPARIIRFNPAARNKPMR